MSYPLIWLDFGAINTSKKDGFALMIQLGRVLGGVGDLPTTYIQLAGAGSMN